MPRALLASLSLAAILVAGPSPVALGQDGGAAPPPAPAAPTAPSEPVQDDAYLRALTDELKKEVERIRGLKFKTDVKCVWKTEAEAREEMLKTVDKEMPPEKAVKYERAAGFYNLIKPGAKIRDIFAEFIAVGALGYYDPETDVFSLLRGYPDVVSRGTVFHELVHALEDQYFDYHARMERHGKEDRDDHAMGVKALVEGSARMFENEYVDSVPGRREAIESGQMAVMAPKAAQQMKLEPALIILMGMYPYNNGAEFLHAVLDGPESEAAAKTRSRTERLADLFAAPPVSTEQVLHPQKFLAGDLPVDVALPDLAPALGEGWAKELENTHGELGTALVLSCTLLPRTVPMQAMAAMKHNPNLPRPVGAQDQTVGYRGEIGKASQGWDGDRYATYGNGPRVAAAWVSVWDSEQDAQEFAEVYAAKVIPRKHKVAKVEPVEGRRWTYEGTGEGVSAVALDGRRVTIVECVPAGTLDKVMAALAGAKVVADPKDTVPAPARKAE